MDELKGEKLGKKAPVKNEEEKKGGGGQDATLPTYFCVMKLEKEIFL